MVKRERETRAKWRQPSARTDAHLRVRHARALVYFNRVQKKKNRERKKVKEVKEKRDRLVKIIQILCFKFRKIRSNPPPPLELFFMTEESTREGRSVGQNARQMFEIFTFQWGRYMKCE